MSGCEKCSLGYLAMKMIGALVMIIFVIGHLKKSYSLWCCTLLNTSIATVVDCSSS